MKKFLALLLSICIVAGTAPLSMAAGSSFPAPVSSDYVANEIILVQDTTVKVAQALPFESAVPIDTDALFEEEGVRALKGTVTYAPISSAPTRIIYRRLTLLKSPPKPRAAVPTTTPLTGTATIWN